MEREVRKESGSIRRALDTGESVGELIPVRQQQFVAVEAVQAAFAGAARVEAKRFRKDVDAMVDQGASPRG